jgi:hypothetical protein
MRIDLGAMVYKLTWERGREEWLISHRRQLQGAATITRVAFILAAADRERSGGRH